jgi:hypothetical protein
MTPQITNPVEQVKQVLQKQNRVAGAIGSWLAVLAPLGSFALAHFAPLGWSTTWERFFSGLLLCSLAFSVPKVFRWARTTFGSWLEGAGFVGLAEGLSLAPHGVHWLLTSVSYYALAVLLGVTAITGACRVALDVKAARAAARDGAKPAPAVALARRKLPARRSTSKGSRR